MARDRLLKYLRDLADLSQGQLQRATKVDTHYICGAEAHGDHLYAPQADRACKALGWKGDPSALWHFVDEVDDVEGNIDWDQLKALRKLGESGKLGKRKRSKKRAQDAPAAGAAGVLAAEAAL